MFTEFLDETAFPLGPFARYAHRKLHNPPFKYVFLGISFFYSRDNE